MVFDTGISAIIGAVVLAYIPVFVRGHFVRKYNRIYDNVNPRLQHEKIKNKEGAELVARCTGAHNNGLEALPVFIAGVLSAYLTGIPNSTVAQVSRVFLVLRFFYIWVYIFGTNRALAGVRSLLWFTSLSCSLYLLYLASNAAAFKLP